MITTFISWTCYGQWLHGDGRGSVEIDENTPGEPWLPPNSALQRYELEQMTQPLYEMDAQRRVIVKEAIIGVCQYRGWNLHALHVRKYHIHCIVSGNADPEKMMNDFKAYASRAMNKAGFDGMDRKRWTRHGSTRYINDERYLIAAIDYVLNKQGEPMERFPENPTR